MLKTKKGFTLAEALTTLMMIGIIAAMTIPVLSSGVENQKKITMFKKLYSSFNNNIQTVLGEKNCASMSCLRAWKTVVKTDESGKPIHNGVLADPTYFNVEFDCPECFELGTIMPNGDMTISEYDKEYTDEETGEIKTKKVAMPDNFSLYILKNSALMALYDFAGNCITTGYVTDANIEGEDKSVDICGIVVFDVNGTKGPDKPGDDLFAFYIADEPVDGSYLIPIGYRGIEDSDNNNTQFNKRGLITSTIGNDGKCLPGEQRGYNCTARIMTSGWKMDNIKDEPDPPEARAGTDNPDENQENQEEQQ